MCGFPASGSRRKAHGVAHGKLLVRSVRQTSPSTACRYAGDTTEDVPTNFTNHERLLTSKTPCTNGRELWWVQKTRGIWMYRVFLSQMGTCCGLALFTLLFRARLQI